METKKWWKSRTVWLGILTLLQPHFPPESQQYVATALGIAIIILRFQTGQPIEPMRWPKRKRKKADT